MKLSTLYIIAILFFSTMGCVHVPPKCSVAIAHSKTEFDVCIGSSEVKTGDRVAFLKKKCSTPSRGNPKKCSYAKIGEGTVLKTLDDHLSTVKLDSEFEITESTLVEPQK